MRPLLERACRAGAVVELVMRAQHELQQVLARGATALHDALGRRDDVQRRVVIQANVEGRDMGGLDFPGDLPEPDYFDFTYFAVTLGVALGSSALAVTATVLVPGLGVPIVGELIEHQRRIGEHAHEPLEAMARLKR